MPLRGVKRLASQATNGRIVTTAAKRRTRDSRRDGTFPMSTLDMLKDPEAYLRWLEASRPAAPDLDPEEKRLNAKAHALRRGVPSRRRFEDRPCGPHLD